MNLSDQNGKSLLHQAIASDMDVSIIRLLLQEGRANPNQPDKNWRATRPLQVACLHNNSPVAQELLDHGADMDVIDPDGLGILDESAVLGIAPNLLGLLLKRGANANHRNPTGKPLLHLAAGSWANEGSVRVLLEFGANPRSKDQNGKLALELACKKGRLGCIYLLFQRMITDGSMTFK